MYPPRPIVAFVLLLTAAISVRGAGPYLKVEGLYNRPSDVQVNNISAFKASLKNNTGLAGAIGYKFSLLRVEGELQYLKSEVEPDETSGTLVGGIGRTIGDIKETSGFVNAFVDFPAFFGLAPYLGAGLGYARVNVDNLARTSNNTPVYEIAGHDSVLGYQGMVGLQYHLLGRATIHAGYRIVKREDVAVREVLANVGRSLTVGNNRMFELGVAIGF